jgi:hypothetical protein
MPDLARKVGQPTPKKRRPGRFRVRSIAAMAAELVARVVELGDDEHCKAALIVAGFNPKDIDRLLEQARTIARLTRAAEIEAWSASQWR